jgi:F-type H+-transporting ATPase subunit epsilon
MAKLSFRLVMPERELLNTEADMVVVPGVEGDFGVLHGHAPLISIVRPGVLEVFQGSKVEQRFMVAGGFAEVTPERCTVLADEALPLSSLDRAAIEQQAKSLEGTVQSLRDHLGRQQGAERDQAAAELRTAERRLAVAAAKLAAIESAAGHG